MCVEIINAADIVSKNVPANVMSIASTNVMSTTSINFHSKKNIKWIVIFCKLFCQRSHYYS